MKKEELKTELRRYIIDNGVNFEEYQNKYFLKKKIKDSLPDLPDAVIYGAIDKTNREVRRPYQVRVYIEYLLNNLQ